MNAQAPAVSVGMLVHNRPQFMRQAIESVLAQTFGDFEFIVLDDASETQEPLAVAREYAAKDSRMRVLRSEENLRFPGGRNKLLAESKAKLFAPIDDDDYWAPEKLQKQASFMRAHPDVGVFSCSRFFINADGEQTGTQILQDEIAPPRGPSAKAGCENYYGAGEILRRDALNAVGGWRKWFVKAEDTDLYFRLEEKCHQASTGDCLLYYRLHGGNWSGAGKIWEYYCAAAYSALCRREGKPDPVAEGVALESLLPEAFMSSAFPPRISRKVMRTLLRGRRYAELRRLLSSHRQNKHYPFAPVKTYLKLAAWSLRYNRPGFWLRK